MKIGRGLLIALSLVLVGQGCVSVSPEDSSNDTTSMIEQAQNDRLVRITTAKGDIVFRLFDDTAPKTADNFVKLTKEGFYNGLTFHRREEGFVIQGGDPNGDGTGGPGYTFEDELNDSHKYDKGIVAMANRGPNTNGSQFFIMLEDFPLPKQYTIFGKVEEGQDVVDAIAIDDVMETVKIETDK
jgi:cyclophilin family peptidyl-prolyl cis-trans isomerase